MPRNYQSVIVCEWCGKTAVIYRNKGETRRFCSGSCRSKHNIRCKKEWGFPFGTIRKRKRGNLLIKIDIPGAKRTQWVSLSQFIAEKMMGRKIAKGERIVFLDGDKFNCSIENIIVVATEVIVPCENCGTLRVCRQNRQGTYCKRCAPCFIDQSKRGSPNVKLTEEEVYAIRLMLSCGVSVTGIASNSGGRFSRGSVSGIKYNKIWKGKGMTNLKKKYEVLLGQVVKMVQIQTASLFDRMTLLCKVFDDPEFQTDIKTTKQAATQVLEKYVADTSCNFTELYHIRKMFPSKDQWQRKGLVSMRQKFLDDLKKKTKKTTTTKKQRVTVTQAQYNDLLQENKLLKQRCEHLEEELKLARDLIETLRGIRKPRLVKHAS